MKMDKILKNNLKRNPKQIKINKKKRKKNIIERQNKWKENPDLTDLK